MSFVGFFCFALFLALKTGGNIYTDSPSLKHLSDKVHSPWSGFSLLGGITQWAKPDLAHAEYINSDDDGTSTEWLCYCVHCKTTAPMLKAFQRIIQWKVACQVFCKVCQITRSSMLSDWQIAKQRISFCPSLCRVLLDLVVELWSCRKKVELWNIYQTT